MKPDLASLTIFVNVVERGTFSATAWQLKLTPSAVSKHITRLEQAMGVRLFIRSTHHMILTEAGKLLYQRARKILSDIDQTVAEVRKAEEDLGGTLKIHVTPGTGKAVALPLVAEFMRAHPYRVEIETSPFMIDVLDEGVDVSIRSGGGNFDFYHRNTYSLDNILLAEVSYVICGTEDYFSRHGTPAHPRDLAAHRCLVCTVQPDPKRWWFKEDGRRFDVEVPAHLASNDWSVVEDALRRGSGLARMQSGQILDDSLVPLFTDLVDETRGVWAFFLRREPIARGAQAFLDFLRKRA